jgi:hypothetical protein
LESVRIKVVYGNSKEVEEKLGCHTAYVERTNLTSRTVRNPTPEWPYHYPYLRDIFMSHGDKPGCIEETTYDLCFGGPLYRRLKKLVGNDKLNGGGLWEWGEWTAGPQTEGLGSSGEV